ncbi:MAG: integrase [Methanobrevibacter sp.]|jgi:integrase|nr:integrase [Candidatus Methanovirga aequatorialis]
MKTEKYNLKKDPKYERFILERNLTKASEDLYYHALTSYSSYNQLTLTKLIDEADHEEEERIRNKNKTLIRRLKEYRNYLINNNKYGVSTVKNYFTKIKTFYKHYEIEIPYLPPIQLKKDYHERYTDIPTIEHIREALEHTNNLSLRALILFMSSSGTARAETLNITVQDFINATSDYHKSKNIDSVLEELKEQEDVIPLFQMTRQKTDYPYYTVCSPEATNAIIRCLQSRKEINNEDKLFNINRTYLNQVFQRLNEKIGWGLVNHYAFFRPHALRKFHATVIEDTGLANALQGRRADPVSESYFKHNPKRLREKYLDHLPKLTVNPVVVTRVDDEGTERIKVLEEALERERLKLLSFEEKLESIMLSGREEREALKKK